VASLQVSDMTKFTWIELGEPRGETLVFLGGWPDDSLSGWSPIFEILKEKYRIVSLCIPQFEANCSEVKSWGYTFHELVDMMDKTINKAGCDTPFTLVIHDWGSIIGMLYQKRFPEKVKSMILVDVGIKGPVPESIWETVLIVLYQWWYAVSYIITQIMGAHIGKIILLGYFGLVFTLPFLKVCPYDTFHRPTNDAINPQLLHIYFRFWKDFFSGRPMKLSFPSCPIYYMVRVLIPVSTIHNHCLSFLKYGKKKNVMFHDKKFMERIENNPKCRCALSFCSPVGSY
jgi:pimeloyl-ACP methyl ester carboxylesterase